MYSLVGDRQTGIVISECGVDIYMYGCQIMTTYVGTVYDAYI